MTMYSYANDYEKALKYSSTPNKLEGLWEHVKKNSDKRASDSDKNSKNDINPHLNYADHLESQGHAAVASFIRKVVSEEPEQLPQDFTPLVTHEDTIKRFYAHNPSTASISSQFDKKEEYANAEKENREVKKLPSHETPSSPIQVSLSHFIHGHVGAGVHITLPAEKGEKSGKSLSYYYHDLNAREIHPYLVNLAHEGVPGADKSLAHFANHYPVANADWWKHSSTPKDYNPNSNKDEGGQEHSIAYRK